MKKLCGIFILFVLILQPAMGSLPPASAEDILPPDRISQPTTVPDGRESNLPGWPIPDKTIPHHEPGHLSRAGAYTTEVLRKNEAGIQELAEISGLDAMAIDGVDPLAGNYQLVNLDKIMMSWNESNQQSIQTFTSTLSTVPGSQKIFDNTKSIDIAAGDLNNDGYSEQIMAWIGAGDHIYLAAGEMPGSPGRTTSAPATIAQTAPPAGSALEFNGSDTYVNTGSGLNLANSSFTISFWARRYAPDDDDIVIGQGDMFDNQGLHIGFLGSNNKFRFAFYNNDLDTPDTYTDSDWHHWACTYDAVTKARAIYRDGVLVAEDISASDYQGSGELDIGKFISASHFFNGLIDEVGVWSSAHTPDQIKLDMTNKLPVQADLLAFWPFDEGSGVTAYDISDNHFDGTLENGLVWSLDEAPLAEIQVLVRGFDDTLWRCSFDADTNRCLSWENAAGGILLSAPAAASQGAGQFDVFAVLSDNQVYQRNWDAGWTGTWVQVGDWPDALATWNGATPELTHPGVVARNGGFDLFRVSADNSLRWFNGASWQPMGGMLASAPGAVSFGSDHMQVFARGMDNALWYLTYNAGTWGPWQYIDLAGMDPGVSIASAPTAVSPAPGQIDVYVLGSDNQMWTINFNGSSWGTWNSISGSIASEVALAGGYTFAQSDDSSLVYRDGAAWDSLGWLPECCKVFDTTQVGTKIGVDPYEDYSVDIEPGYFLGDGRSQIALAYQNQPGWVKIALLQAQGGFLPEQVAEVTIPHTAEWFKITTGDFVGGDGIDEVALAFVHGQTYGVDIVQFSGGTLSVIEGPHVTDTHTCYDGSQPMQFAGTLEVVSGDFDADGQDEIAATYLLYCESYRMTGNCKTFRYHARTRIYDVTDQDTFITYFIEDMWNPGPEQLRTSHPWSVGLALSAGDVDGDGQDELIRTWPSGFGGNVSCTYFPFPPLSISLPTNNNFQRSFRVDKLPSGAWPAAGGQLSNNLLTPGELSGITGDSYVDRLAAGDLDLDSKVEPIWNIGNNADRVLRTYDYDVINGWTTFNTILPLFDYPSLVTGDFTRESLRVGPPSYRMQQAMTSPEVFLNLPPMHRDVLTGVGEVIEINNGATAQYQEGDGSTSASSSESKRDWSLSVGLELSVGAGGHKVSTSLDNTYGENFSKVTNAITSYLYDATTTAEFYDQVIYNATNYGVWEYPVLGVETPDPDQPATIAVVFPLADTTTRPSTAQGRACDENFYAPSHQPYNVWSYDRIGDPRFEDYEPAGLIEANQTQGGQIISVSMSEVDESSLTDSFHNQISAGLEYSYENELNIPLIGKAWDFSFKAKTNSDYGFEKISTLSSTFTHDTGVTIDLPSNADSSTYNIKAYLYWAKGGYLVLDYQAEPYANSGSWGLYNKTDPAFILPWYGYPDPVTGLFPALPNPDAPPCGMEKQLFTHDVEIEPAYAQNGDTVILRATVRNFSNITPPADVLIKFYLGYPATGNQIGSCSIAKAQVTRYAGPASCETNWQVSNSWGEEKIFAVIDPGRIFDEMHDENDLINNNIGYGLLQAANADYFDPGLEQVQVFQPILYEKAPGLGYDLYLPTSNFTETIRYELVPKDLGSMSIIGDPIQVMAFHGGQQAPDEFHVISPAPAGLMASYNDTDLLPGMKENNLKLFRLDGLVWVEGTCPGYHVMRFPTDNRVAVPICQTGVYVLSDMAPTSGVQLFLPVIRK